MKSLTFFLRTAIAQFTTLLNVLIRALQIQRRAQRLITDGGAERSRVVRGHGTSLCGARGCATRRPAARRPRIDLQHPASVRGAERTYRTKPLRKVSSRPDFNPDGRPRSATVVIRRKDGGLIGT